MNSQKEVLDQLLGRQNGRNRPTELNLTRKNSNDFMNSSVAMGKLSLPPPGEIDPKYLLATSGTSVTNASVRLLSEFKYVQGPAVSFPPISPQEAQEKTRTYQLGRAYSNKQRKQIPAKTMRAI